MELYTDAELAPYGEGHPTARAVEKREYVVPFGAKESEEIDEERPKPLAATNALRVRDAVSRI